MWEDLKSISPLSFFALSYDLFYSEPTKTLIGGKKYLLPSTSEYLDEKEFAEVFCGWNEQKLLFHFEVNTEVENVLEDFRKGDSIELFLDTRDMKNKATTTRFCHHFVFYPMIIQGFFGKEITRFRGDDIHALCDPNDLIIHAEIKPQRYFLDITIPAQVLHGYDPTSFDRLGFTYQINRSDGSCQNFSVSSKEYTIENHPSLWASFRLKK